MNCSLSRASCNNLKTNSRNNCAIYTRENQGADYSGHSLHKMQTAHISGSWLSSRSERSNNDLISSFWCLTNLQQWPELRTTFDCIYMNTFMSTVSCRLDKLSPKLLDQDKPWLELAVVEQAVNVDFVHLYRVFLSHVSQGPE